MHYNMLPLLIMGLLVACFDRQSSRKTFSDPYEAQASNEPVKDPHVALIIDQGFSLHSPNYINQLAATYTFSCPHSLNLLFMLSGHYESNKKKLLDYVAAEQENCFLREGLETDISLLKGFAQVKERWNQNLLRGEPFPNVHGAMPLFHGTMVASLIAFRNPSTRLVLVQRNLISITPRETMALFFCSPYSQVLIDRAYRLFKDEDVRTAFLRKPHPVSLGLAAIIRRHNVTLVNKSYTAPQARQFENFRARSCPHLPPLKLELFFNTIDALFAERDRKHGFTYDQRQALTFKAAGNDAIEVKKCTTSDRLILVGSSMLPGVKAEHSNWGHCVSLYNLGDEVITRLPYGLLGVASGTSFAAPLTLRYVSLHYSPSSSPREIKRRLLRLADQRGFLPSAAFPHELSYRLRIGTRFSLGEIAVPVISLFGN